MPVEQGWCVLSLNMKLQAHITLVVPDECAPSTSSMNKVSSPDISGQSPVTIGSSSPMNPNESICLRLTCMCAFSSSASPASIYITRYVNATLGNPCIMDSTVYVGSGPKGEKFSNIVLRDNCISPGLYCNSTTNVCEQTQAIGLACQNDLECESVSLVVMLSRTLDPHIVHNVVQLQSPEHLCGTSRDTSESCCMAVCRDECCCSLR